MTYKDYQYFLVASRSIAGLEKAVNEYILSGWIPQGGICFSEGDYLQAMSKLKA